MRRLILLIFPLALAACTVGAPPPPAATAPAAEPDIRAAWYRKAARQGQHIYTIDPARSLITVTVRRGGALARLGHDHVIASRTVEGYVAPSAGRADFHFRLDQMTVDEPALRTEAGLDTQPSQDAIIGTRTNMLNRVLEAERFPLVLLNARRASAQAREVQLTVTLHGVTRSVAVPLRQELSAGSMTVSGELSLLQTDFGITPMSVMGGAMVVQDRMELRFRLVAVR